MKTFFISVLVIALAVGGAFLYRDFYLKRKFRRLTEEKYAMVAPLIQRISANQRVAESEILELAGNSSLRYALFVSLATAKRADLFPLVYLTQEKGAESSLVNWLEFPTELGVVPDEIEFMEKVALPDSDVCYYAFRYRMVSSHWATKFGWLMGVAGPYREDSLPYDLPRKVFSRFNAADGTSVREEVEWVDANVNRG